MKTDEKKVENKKTPKVSASYTLNALGEATRKLNQIGLISDEDAKTIKEIQRKGVQKHMEKEFNMTF